MSFPLAKQLLNPRSLLSLDKLESRARAANDSPLEHLSFSAKAVATFATQFLLRTRSRAILTGGYQHRAAVQLYDLWNRFMEWSRRNRNFETLLKASFPQTTFRFPAQKRAATFGFFDDTFVKDLGMSLIGLPNLF